MLELYRRLDSSSKNLKSNLDMVMQLHYTQGKYIFG
jgi:hypothetical protein